MIYGTIHNRFKVQRLKSSESDFSIIAFRTAPYMSHHTLQHPSKRYPYSQISSVILFYTVWYCVISFAAYKKLLILDTLFQIDKQQAFLLCNMYIRCWLHITKWVICISKCWHKLVWNNFVETEIKLQCWEIKIQLRSHIY